MLYTGVKSEPSTWPILQILINSYESSILLQSEFNYLTVNTCLFIEKKIRTNTLKSHRPLFDMINYGLQTHKNMQYIFTLPQ